MFYTKGIVGKQTSWIRKNEEKNNPPPPLRQLFSKNV